MTSSGSGRYVSRNYQKEPPLSVVQRGPLVQIPVHSFPVRVLLRGVKDKPPFKQLHQKGHVGGDCRTFTSDLLSGQVKYPQELDEY